MVNQQIVNSYGLVDMPYPASIFKFIPAHLFRYMSDNFTGGKLKLKGVKDGKVKKKKKKKLNEETVKSEIKRESEESSTSTPTADSVNRPRVSKTKAEIAFLKAQQKREGEKILNKAQTSHKERVEQFNEHLDNLIEHFDIPKVSWTK
jgi:protein FAM32A